MNEKKLKPEGDPNQVVIIGGGLAGLTAAYTLHKAGIGFVLLEARDRLGGRILTADASGAVSVDGYDLGPSWFWPDMQPAMASLVTELNLKSFIQQTEGDVVFHRMSREKAQRFRGVGQQPQSMRLAGGTGAIISALAGAIPDASVRTGCRVEGVSIAGDWVETTFTDSAGGITTFHSSHVVLAAPPRLLENSVKFEPPLDDVSAARWRDTPTWMAPHAKFFAIYERAFWLEAGLSGTAQSMVGPMVEIHDATTSTGKPALFGFLGVGAEQRSRMEREVVIRACIDQLVLLFGPEAAAATATLYKDWAADPLTATPADRSGGGHPLVGTTSWTGKDWEGRVIMAGSETSDAEPGYLAGAVQAGSRAAADIIGKSNR